MPSHRLPFAALLAGFLLGVTSLASAEGLHQFADPAWGPQPIRLVAMSNGDSDQALAGIALVAGALQGHLPGIGRLRCAELTGGLIPGASVLGGLLIAMPEPKALEASDAMLALAGIELIVAVLLVDRGAAGRITSPGGS